MKRYCGNKKISEIGLNWGIVTLDFFHSYMLQMRKFNRINGLHNKDGEWMYDPDDIKSKAITYFQQLYKKMSTPMKGLPPRSFPQLESIDQDFLGKVITDEEIKKAFLYDLF